MDVDSIRVYAPLNKKGVNKLNKDGSLTITGVAATTNKDLNNEILTAEVIESLSKQAVGLNLFLEHKHDYNGAIGSIKKAENVNNELRIVADVIPEYAKELKQKLDLGMNFGLSIAGFPELSNVDYRVITAYDLKEISLTPMPANWDTFGTIRAKNLIKSNCFSGACNSFLEMIDMNKKEELNTKEEIEMEETPVSLDDVVNLINTAFAEKKESMVEEIKNEIKNIIESKIEEMTPSAEIENKEADEPKEDEEEDIVEEQIPDEVSEDEEEDAVKLDEKSMRKMLNELKEEITNSLQKPSKFQQVMNSKKLEDKTSKSTFLNSSERDQYGRNKKYL